ncbi:hypothetical protein LI221_03335 [Faecalimonas umbilicata]|nr:hypothetical protein [Faecalimonas umbilicata]
MLGEANGERKAVGLFLGECFRFLALGHDHFQMVICGIFTELFFKIGSAELLSEQRELHILQGNGVLVKGKHLIFVRTDKYPVAFVVEVAKRVQLHKFLPETPRIAAAVNIACFSLYQSQKIYELLYGGRVGELPFHLVGGHIGKVGAPHIFKQTFLKTVQVTDKVGEPQGKGIPFVGGRQVPLSVNKTLPCHFPLGVDFILRGRHAFQIIGIVVFLFRVEIAVVTDKLTQAFLHL